MKRFLTELFKPSLKCKRLGHKYKFIKRRAYIYPLKYCLDVIVEEHLLRLKICSRCKEEDIQAREILDVECITNLEMPPSRWDELKRKGILFL